METSELIEFLRERMHINVNIETESEYSGEYAIIGVSIDIVDDEGESQVISHDYSSVRINRD